MIDQDDIKAMAKELGVPASVLTAQSPKNDAFYAGTPTQVKQAEWFGQLWFAAGYSTGVHLRRAHYWAVSKGFDLPWQIKQGKQQTAEYLNTVAAWKFLCQAAKMARYLGIVDISAIEDHKNPDPMVNMLGNWSYEWHGAGVHFEDPKIDPDFQIIMPGYADLAPYHLEIWCEKSTMNDILAPVARRHYANLCTFQGEASLTAIHDLARRIEKSDRPARIFYVSDYDPAGASMPLASARKLEWMLSHYDIEADVAVIHVALNGRQVREHQIPRTPLKDSETRADRFESVHGEGGAELDALEAIHPGLLRRILENAMAPYYDEELYWKIRNANDKARELAAAHKAEVMAKYRERIEKTPWLKELHKELNNLELPEKLVEWDPSDLVANEDGRHLLFHSTRTYPIQMLYYLRFAGRKQKWNRLKEALENYRDKNGTVEIS